MFAARWFSNYRSPPGDKKLFSPVYLAIITCFLLQFGSTDRIKCAISQIDKRHNDFTDKDEINHLPDKATFYKPAMRYDDVAPSTDEPYQPNVLDYRSPDRQNRLTAIEIYSFGKKKWLKYDRLSEFWSRRYPDAYALSIDNYGRPGVKSVQKIHWTMDLSTIPDDIRIIVTSQSNNITPPLPPFIDATNCLGRDDRLHIIQNTLQEAFDYWAIALEGKLVFQYIPYSDVLKNSMDFDNMITVAMTDIVHANEHTNLTERFSSGILAHAAQNFIHFNRETEKFYVAPHLTSQRIYTALADENVNSKMIKLLEQPGKTLAKKYNFVNYAQLYRKSQRIIYQLAGAADFRKIRQRPHRCLACVALHEVGHVLGLGHSDQSDSIMYKDNVVNEAILSGDDIKAVRALYSPFMKLAKSIEKKHALRACYKYGLVFPEEGSKKRRPDSQ